MYFSLFLFAGISILFSFLCSIWEAVLLSITPSYINVQRQEGTQLGKDLEVFKEDIDRPLSAILTLNTIAHTVGAIGVGAEALKLFNDEEKWSLDYGLIHITMESFVAVVMTLAILILSEIIPKTIGANQWRRLAPFTVKSLKILLFILRPLVWVTQLITKKMKNDKSKPVLSRVDFVAMTQAGAESGALEANESEIIKNLLRFDRIPVKSIMTPRTVAVMAEEERTVKDFYEAHQPLRFSRIPIYEKARDHVTGLVLKDDLLEHMIKGHGDWPLQKIKKEILAIDQDKRLPELFDALTKNRTHLAIVVDEFGGLAGLVTMEDVLETLLGLEIVDEMDAVADLQDLARKKWEERARLLGLIE